MAHLNLLPSLTGGTASTWSGSGALWATLVEDVGNFLWTNGRTLYIRSTLSSTDRWLELFRVILVFDLSTLPVDAVITYAAFTPKVGGGDPLNIQPDICVYLAHPTSYTVLASTDYNKSKYDLLPLTAILTWEEIPQPAAFIELPLNTDGKAALLAAAGGKIAFGLREVNYDVGEVAPAWSAGALEDYIYFTWVYSSDRILKIRWKSIPTVSTNDVTNIALTTATLNGILDDDGEVTTNVRFEYGLDTGYGTYTDWQAGMSEGAFSAGIAGLLPGRTYHYRAIATNAYGQVYGADAEFTTLKMTRSQGCIIG